MSRLHGHGYISQSLLAAARERSCPGVSNNEEERANGDKPHAKVFQEIVCGRKGVVGKEDANVFLIKIL